MPQHARTSFSSHPWLWFVRIIGIIVPRRLRADWRQEWEAELCRREALLADWSKLNWRTKTDLCRRSFGAFADALWLQQRRLESDMFQDLRYGTRMLLKSRGFTLVACLSLALGIGANTAIFSLINAVMLKSLPIAEPQRLVLFGTAQTAGISIGFPSDSCDIFSYSMFRELRQRSQSFSDIAALHSFQNRVHGLLSGNGPAGETEQISAQLVSGNYFSLLGVNPMIGRTFSDEDDAPPALSPVAVANYAWWERRFGRDPSIIGTNITIGNTGYTIIGVMPKGFFGTTIDESPDIWVPLAMEEVLPPGWKGLNDQMFQSLYIVGRLKDGTSIAQAQPETNALFRQILEQFSGSEPSRDRSEQISRARIELTPAGRGLSRMRDDFALPLKILMVVVGVVLLIACANIANLLLARTTTREQELVVRIALGAGPSRIIRQLLTESLLLSLVGGAAGILLGSWGSRLLVLMVSAGPEAVPLNVPADVRVLAFTLAVSILSALLFGMAPALRASRLELTSSLRANKGAAAGMTRSGLGRLFIVVQVGLSLVLLIGAGLFVRTLINLQHVDTGFRQDNVLLLEIDTDSVGLKEDSNLAKLYTDVERRVRAVPGVAAASFSMFLFNQGQWTGPAFAVGDAESEADPPLINNNNVGPDYFEAMGLPILDGRGFGSQDTDKSPKVAVISEAMAHLFFGGESPIGRRFAMKARNHNQEFEVIGVVKDAKYGDLMEHPKPMAYHVYTQESGYLNNLVVNYSGRLGGVIGEIRKAVKDANAQLPIVEAITMSEHVDRSLVQQKLIAKLSGVFGALALLLACLGLFGIMSYSVAKRTNEIGVRMALGAGRKDVLILVMRQGLMPVAVGIAIGIPAALWASRVVASLLFGLSPTDPLTVAGATALLVGVAVLAGYLPARRASRVDPMTALRRD